MPCRSLKIKPFTLPLSPDQFAAALQSGHGRALMHAKAHGANGVESHIIHSCLYSRIYEPLLDFERADWMLEILIAAGFEDPVADALLPVLTFEREKDKNDHRLQCRLAMLLSRRGRPDLRAAINRLLPLEEKFHETEACDLILEFDGADGLTYLADQAGRWLSSEQSLYVGSWMMEEYDERHGTGAAERILTAAAAHNKFISVYMQEVYEDREEDEAKSIEDRCSKDQPQKVPRPETAAELIQYVQSLSEWPNNSQYWLTVWGKRANPFDRERVFEELHSETDAMRISLYLRTFFDCGMPQWSDKVLEWGASTDEFIRWGAFNALANHQHPAVRALALKGIRNGSMTDGELRLLLRNYLPGDWDEIKEHLSIPDDPHARHDMLRDLQGLYEVVEEPNAAMPHILVYEHSPCGNCRRCAVESLIKQGTAPAWLLEECRFDCEKDIRKLVSKGVG